MFPWRRNQQSRRGCVRIRVSSFFSEISVDVGTRNDKNQVLIYSYPLQADCRRPATGRLGGGGAATQEGQRRTHRRRGGRTGRLASGRGRSRTGSCCRRQRRCRRFPRPGHQAGGGGRGRQTADATPKGSPRGHEAGRGQPSRSQAALHRAMGRCQLCREQGRWAHLHGRHLRLADAGRGGEFISFVCLVVRALQLG